MSASALIDLVRALDAPYGLERSVKIGPGVLMEDRFLITLHRSALGAAAADRLAQMGRALDLPQDFADAIAQAQGDADLVHFGYEGGASATYKIYLEYASRVRRAQAQNAGDPVLVYLAYKWMPGAPGHGAATTRYSWLPCRDANALAARLRTLVPGAQAPRALRCGLDLLSRAAARTQPRHLFLMEVEEPGNPRRSYDINVYRAELHLHDIADLVGAVATDFAVPQPQVSALLERCGALTLGHLSGGRGRDGDEFVTVYYGIEAY